MKKMIIWFNLLRVDLLFGFFYKEFLVFKYLKKKCIEKKKNYGVLRLFLFGG